MIYQSNQLILNSKYRIEKLLGKGAFGEVYLATHLRLNAPRALKVLAKRDNVGSTVFGDYQRRFELESRLGARLNHPRVIQVYDLDEEGSTLVLAMEYAPGGTLRDRLAALEESGKRMPVSEVLRIGTEMAEGLRELHRIEAVHRDIKPSNILFDREGHAKIGDLGLAQLRGGASQRSQMSQAERHPGTPEYMSPEQANSYAYLNPASDIFTLGAVLFEMLTGKLYLHERPGTRAKKYNDATPDWLDELLVRMTSKNPEERPWNGEELLEELKQGGKRENEAEARRQHEQALKEKQAAEERAKAEMEARMRAELEEKIRREQTEKERREAEARLKREQEEQARQEAERQKSLAREGQPLALDLGGGARLDMVWVPAGSFWMGDDQSKWDFEKPKHQVNLAGFWMGKYPVTNAQYRVFTRETQGREPLGGFPAGRDAHPVVNVSWHDAMDFARWLDQKFKGRLGQGMCLRLPTEAEWEKAARGTDGRIYPWGNGEANSGLCNFKDSKIDDTTPVGKYSPRSDSPYGCADMAGNVWEWTHSQNKPYPYQAGDGREDEAAEGKRVVRGGSFYFDADALRCAERGADPGFLSLFGGGFGFRVCVGPILT